MSADRNFILDAGVILYQKKIPQLCYYILLDHPFNIDCTPIDSRYRSPD